MDGLNPIKLVFQVSVYDGYVTALRSPIHLKIGA
jgi:hypothetical protein